MTAEKVVYWFLVGALIVTVGIVAVGILVVVGAMFLIYFVGVFFLAALSKIISWW